MNRLIVSSVVVFLLSTLVAFQGEVYSQRDNWPIYLNSSCLDLLRAKIDNAEEISMYQKEHWLVQQFFHEPIAPICIDINCELKIHFVEVTSTRYFFIVVENISEKSCEILNNGYFYTFDVNKKGWRNFIKAIKQNNVDVKETRLLSIFLLSMTPQYYTKYVSLDVYAEMNNFETVESFLRKKVLDYDRVGVLTNQINFHKWRKGDALVVFDDELYGLRFLWRINVTGEIPRLEEYDELKGEFVKYSRFSTRVLDTFYGPIPRVSKR